MRKCLWGVLLVAVVILLPSSASAQASIAAVSSCENLTALTAWRPARTVWAELLLLALDTSDIRPPGRPLWKKTMRFSPSPI